MQFPNGLQALNHRDFRIFWFGQLVSLIGSWMQSLGQAWLILQLTGSPFKLGIISTLQFAPFLFFSLVAGAVTDRIPKRKLIIGTQTTLMLLAFTLSALVWTGTVQYWHVAVLAVLLGLVNTLDMPARQSYLVELVGKDDLMNAIALNSASFNGARILGPAAAGLLIARYGVALGFFINGLSFVAVIAALFATRAEGLPRPRRGASLGNEIREGVRYVLGNPQSLFVLSLLGVVSLFVINFPVLIPLLAKQILHQEAAGLGLLMSAMGAGALVGAVVLAMVGNKRPSLIGFAVPGVILCTATLLMASFPHLGSAAATLAVIGFSQILFSASGNTFLQVTTPDELRGRVMSLYTLVFAGTTPIGAFFIGAITERWGASAGWVVSGALGLLCALGLVAWWWLARPDRNKPNRLFQIRLRSE